MRCRFLGGPWNGSLRDDLDVTGGILSIDGLGTYRQTGQDPDGTLVFFWGT